MVVAMVPAGGGGGSSRIVAVVAVVASLVMGESGVVVVAVTCRNRQWPDSRSDHRTAARAGHFLRQVVLASPAMRSLQP